MNNIMTVPKESLISIIKELGEMWKIVLHFVCIK